MALTLVSVRKQAGLRKRVVEAAQSVDAFYDSHLDFSALFEYFVCDGGRHDLQVRHLHFQNDTLAATFVGSVRAAAQAYNTGVEPTVRVRVTARIAPVAVAWELNYVTVSDYQLAFSDSDGVLSMTPSGQSSLPLRVLKLVTFPHQCLQAQALVLDTSVGWQWCHLRSQLGGRDGWKNDVDNYIVAGLDFHKSMDRVPPNVIVFPVGPDASDVSPSDVILHGLQVDVFFNPALDVNAAHLRHPHEVIGQHHRRVVVYSRHPDRMAAFMLYKAMLAAAAWSASDENWTATAEVPPLPEYVDGGGTQQEEWLREHMSPRAAVLWDAMLTADATAADPDPAYVEAVEGESQEALADTPHPMATRPKNRKRPRDTAK